MKMKPKLMPPIGSRWAGLASHREYVLLVTKHQRRWCGNGATPKKQGWWVFYKFVDGKDGEGGISSGGEASYSHWKGLLKEGMTEITNGLEKAIRKMKNEHTHS